MRFGTRVMFSGHLRSFRGQNLFHLSVKVPTLLQRNNSDCKIIRAWMRHITYTLILLIFVKIPFYISCFFFVISILNLSLAPLALDYILVFA